MDFATIQHELETLPEDEQDRLAAFLTALRMKRKGMFSEIRRRLDDREPANWRECQGAADSAPPKPMDSQ